MTMTITLTDITRGGVQKSPTHHIRSLIERNIKMMKHNEIKTKLMEAIPERQKVFIKADVMEIGIDALLDSFEKDEGSLFAEDVPEKFGFALVALRYMCQSIRNHHREHEINAEVFDLGDIKVYIQDDCVGQGMLCIDIVSSNEKSRFYETEQL